MMQNRCCSTSHVPLLAGECHLVCTGSNSTRTIRWQARPFHYHRLYVINTPATPIAMLSSSNSDMRAFRCMASAATVQSTQGSVLMPRRCRRQLHRTLCNHVPRTGGSVHMASAVAQAAAVTQLPPPRNTRHRSSFARRAANNDEQQTITQTSSDTAAPLQVTRSNFNSVLPAVKQALQDCQFFTFDCEMTGLFLQNQDDYVVDDVADRYVKVAAAAEQFLVVQLGLSLFKWTGSSYEVRSFNFHLFPMPYEDVDVRFMSQASALAFLASQGFDFNKMIYEGVPYLPLSWRDKQLKASADALKASPPSLDDLDEDELCFMTHLESTITNWLAAAPAAAYGSSSSDTAAAAAPTSSSSSSSDTLYLPAPPPQLQKLQRRLLAAGIGSSKWRSSSSSSSSSEERLYIVQQPAAGSGAMLKRATSAQVAAEHDRHILHHADEVTAATGFSQIFELLRDSCKPAVGHNIRFDLAYCIAAFIQSPLPKTWAGYRALVAKWFPGGIYDTKYLATCFPGGGSSSSTNNSGSSSGRVLVDTSLGPLYNIFAQADPASPEQLCGSSSSSGTAMFTKLSAWLQDQTLNLDNSNHWQTLPQISHAQGCEQYAAAAAAGSGNSGSSSSSSLAHEAGYDAFMTGVVFVGLLRLYELDGLTQVSRWQLPVSPSAPPSLVAVQQYAWRQFHTKGKDIHYAALQGPEQVPQRPEVVYITGFPPGTRWQDIQRKLSALGLGKPTVSFVRAQGVNSSPTGAYLIMPSAKQATKVVQAIRADKKWKVQAMTYSDYWYSQHGKSLESSDGSTAAVRPPPVLAVQSDGAESAGSTGNTAASAAAVVQQLQTKTAAALKRKAEEDQIKAEQKEYETWLENVMDNKQVAEQTTQPTEPQPLQQQNGSSSSSSQQSMVVADRQRRLEELQKAAASKLVRPVSAAAALQLKRPPPPPQR